MTITNDSSGLVAASLYQASTEQRHQLGTRAEFVFGSNKDKSAVAVYIKAAAALTAGDICELPLIAGTDAFNVDTALTKTNAAAIADTQNDSFAACVPAATLASGEYGWAFIRGLIPINTAASCVQYARLGLTATAGRIDDADVDYQLVDTHVISTVGGAAAVSDCFATTDLRIFRNAA